MIQLNPKPIDKMTIEELRQERECHSWQAQKSERGADSLQRRLYWLDDNKPIQTYEEAREAYNSGDKTAFARRAKAIGDRKRTERKADYSRAVAESERAFIGLIDERLLELEAKAKRPKRGRPPKHDPRKKQIKQQTYKKPKNLRSVKECWRIIDTSNKAQAQLRSKLAPIPNFDRDKLKQIARAQGIYTDEGFIYYLSQELEMSTQSVEKALKEGRFTFGQILLIGAFLEMTPKTFCDTFLSGYFVDRAGNFVAEVSDKRALLKRPIEGDITDKMKRA